MAMKSIITMESAMNTDAQNVVFTNGVMDDFIIDLLIEMQDRSYEEHWPLGAVTQDSDTEQEENSWVNESEE